MISKVKEYLKRHNTEGQTQRLSPRAGQGSLFKDSESSDFTILTNAYKGSVSTYFFCIRGSDNEGFEQAHQGWKSTAQAKLWRCIVL